MKLPLVAAISLSLVLAGCGSLRDSRMNPFNWFGKSRAGASTTLEPTGGYAANARDFRVLVEQVTKLEIAANPEGAIISAAGLPPTQGWWDTELVAENDGVAVNGVLTYRFVVAAPVAGTAVASRVLTPQSREVTVATFVSNIKLDGVRQIVVTGSANSRSVRR